VPIYEYACKKCDHKLDALQKMSDDPLLDCPECGEPALKRLLSAPRFRLKGKGWYETDFKKDNQRNVHKPDTEPAKTDKAESKADKSETKKAKKESGSSSESKADKK
jgi:putative FmdB family regulatory protein